jgi:hypothetical protein
MGTISKEFAETLLQRVQAGKHINTTVHEEEQLIRAWLYWNEHYYQPRLQALRSGQLSAAQAPHAQGITGTLGGDTSDS